MGALRDRSLARADLSSCYWTERHVLGFQQAYSSWLGRLFFACCLPVFLPAELPAGR